MRIGVTWYTEQEWRLVRDAASDAERLEASYAEWVAMAEEATKDMLAAGIVTERVSINASQETEVKAAVVMRVPPWG